MMPTDGSLFWRFMHTHHELFKKNPRMNMLLNMFDKMDAGNRLGQLQTAEGYLSGLDAVHGQ